MARGENLNLAALVNSMEGGGYGLPTELLDAFSTFTRVKELTIETPPTLDSESAAAKIVAATAANKTVDLIGMAAQVAEISLGKQRHDEALHILRLAIEQAGENATLLCADLSERIITEYLRPALEQVYKQTRDVAVDLAGYDIGNPHTIITAPAKVRNAFVLLPGLAAKRSAIFAARSRVNSIGHRTPKYDVGGIYSEFETPLALTPSWKPGAQIQIREHGPSDSLAWMLWMVTDGAIAKPWLPTVAEQDEAWLAQFAPTQLAQARAAESAMAAF